MATSQIAVHGDENATSTVNRVKCFEGSKSRPTPSDSDKVSQPSFRKALSDVNQVPKSSGIVGQKKFQGNTRLKPARDIQGCSLDVENEPSRQGLVKETTAVKNTYKHPKKKTHVKVIPQQNKDPKQIVEQDGHDSDSESILPHSYRLSSYVDRLLRWRPPCLFGSLPDSASESSDTEEQNIPKEEMPISLVHNDEHVVDLDLSNLLGDFPTSADLTPLSPLQMDFPSDLSLTQTPDTSFSFGSLKVMTSPFHSASEPTDQSLQKTTVTGE